MCTCIRSALHICALLITVLPGFAGSADSPQPGFPDTAAGRCAAAFFDAFRSGSQERMTAFFAGVVSPEGLKQRSASQRAERMTDVRKEIGEVEFRRVDALPPDKLVLVAQDAEKRLYKWTFTFGPPPDTYLLSLALDQAETEDLAGPPPPLTEAEAIAAIEKTVSEQVAADSFSGVVLVARDGKPLLHRAWGLASVEHEVANRSDTKFNLGSINKIFTKVAIAQLLESGRLSLDDTIGKHLRDYPNTEAARKVTIRQLIDMQSGIGDFFGKEFDATPKDHFRTNSDYLPLFAGKPLLFEPGTNRQYSNGGYLVLGQIVAKASGQDYFDYVRENIYKRAGMADTDWYEADVPVPNVAEGYTRHWDGESRDSGPRRNNIYTRPARGSSAGGGYSTAQDLLRFANALLGDRLLAPAYTEWIIGRVEPVPGQPIGDRKSGGISIAGGAPGINAFLSVDRPTGIILVVLANEDPPTAEDVAGKARRILQAIRP